MSTINHIRNNVRYRTRDLVNFFMYGKNAPKAAELIWVNPKDIHHIIDGSTTNLPRKKTGTVEGGDWDLRKSPFDNLGKYKACVQHFKHQKTWEEAGAYSNILERIKQRGEVDRCKNLHDIIERYKSIDDTYLNIQQNGFLPRRHFKSRNFREAGGIYIHIDRNGDLIFSGAGCHRVSIAKILEVKRMPAQLGVVHEMAIKEQVWERHISRAK